MTNKEKYIEFCSQEKEMPIFSQNWWLDIVCENAEWDVVIVEKGGRIVASMPYFRGKKSIFKSIYMPSLTQTLGPYVKYPAGQKYSKRLSFEKKVFSEIIKKLPTFDYFRQNFNVSITNWLPFYWEGFEQTTRYTYLIEKGSDLETIYSRFESNIRTDIKKSEKIVKVESSDDIEKFYRINSMSFERQNIKTPYSFDFVKKLDACCKTRECRKMFFAIDADNNIHASIYIIWDDTKVYYIMGGGDPKYRNSGATSLLIWEAIRYACQTNKVFDFEGSMMTSVEKFVRAFGAVQKPYFSISKTNSKLIKLGRLLKELL